MEDCADISELDDAFSAFLPLEPSDAFSHDGAERASYAAADAVDDEPEPDGGAAAAAYGAD